MTNTLQTVPSLVGRSYEPAQETASDRNAKEAARGRGVSLVIFSYVLFGLAAVVVLPFEGKVLAALGLMGYVVHIALRRKGPVADQSGHMLRRPQ
ncbi:hypothetical protein [Pseudooceanicola sp. MF1-13]|uniref:hypothetical protein n=1 Tax=Pseudooceanicola sp. MF1-13 TaxID=3379095 RepID=UPI003891232B